MSDRPRREAANNEAKTISVKLWEQLAIRILENGFLKFLFIITSIMWEGLIFKIF